MCDDDNSQCTAEVIVNEFAETVEALLVRRNLNSAINLDWQWIGSCLSLELQSAFLSAVLLLVFSSPGFVVVGLSPGSQNMYIHLSYPISLQYVIQSTIHLLAFL